MEARNGIIEELQARLAEVYTTLEQTTAHKDHEIQLLRMQLIEQQSNSSMQQAQEERKSEEDRTVFLKYCELKQENRKLKHKLKRIEREDEPELKRRSKSVQGPKEESYSSSTREKRRKKGAALPSIRTNM